MSDKELKQNEEKVTVCCYVSLILAIVFFSGVAAGGSYAWSVLDFSTLMGSAGKMVGSVVETPEGLKTTLTTMRGIGGSGAIDGFMMAISLIVPGVMLAMGMIAVFEHYGALRAAKQLLTPVLQFLIGVPGTATLALIACLQSTVLLAAKFIGANIMRLIQWRLASRENSASVGALIEKPAVLTIERN